MYFCKESESMKNAAIQLLICFIVLTSLSNPSRGQAIAWTEYNTINSSLPDNSIRCITYENDSTVWIGTDFGLAKLVNGQWTNYNTSNSGLASNSIRSMAIDKSGVKWIGTFTNGLCSFNDTVWTNINTFNSPLPDDFIRSLAIDTNNVLWAGTTGGLVRIDSLVTFTIYDQFNSIMNSSNIASMYVDTLTNNKWIGTVNGGLILIDKDTNFTEFYTGNSGISDNTLLGLDMDATGNLFMASPANGLLVKLSGFGWVTYNLVSSNIPTASLTCLKLDDIDQPWIGTADKGLLYKNGSNFIVYDTANSPLTDVVIQCVNIDDSGKVWIGTQTGGLFILDPSLLTGISSSASFTNVSVYPNPANEVLFYNSPFPTVNCEITDLSGRLLLSESGTSNQIDIHALSTGLYQVRFIYEDGNSITRKFLKQ